MVDKLAYTVSEAAEAVGVHRATIYRLVKAGELRLVKFAGRSVILAEDLKEALHRAASTAAAYEAATHLDWRPFDSLPVTTPATTGTPKFADERAAQLLAGELRTIAAAVIQ